MPRAQRSLVRFFSFFVFRFVVAVLFSLPLSLSLFVSFHVVSPRFARSPFLFEIYSYRCFSCCCQFCKMPLSPSQVHQLASFYFIDSAAFDFEPKRWVRLARTAHSSVPMTLLSTAIKLAAANAASGSEKGASGSGNGSGTSGSGSGSEKGASGSSNISGTSTSASVSRGTSGSGSTSGSNSSSQPLPRLRTAEQWPPHCALHFYDLAPGVQPWYVL
jgi:hypothetical protein